MRKKYRIIIDIKFIFMLALSLTVLCVSTTQHAKAESTPSEAAASFAKLLSNNCLKRWNNPTCLSNISQSALVLAANYAGDLQSNGMVGAVEQVKQHCAAATAGTKGDYPAYAMQSAFTECANIIYDVSEQTKIKPDNSHYQLLVGSIMCLNKDRSCPSIEHGLLKFQ